MKTSLSSIFRNSEIFIESCIPPSPCPCPVKVILLVTKYFWIGMFSPNEEHSEYAQWKLFFHKPFVYEKMKVLPGRRGLSLAIFFSTCHAVFNLLFNAVYMPATDNDGKIPVTPIKALSQTHSELQRWDSSLKGTRNIRGGTKLSDIKARDEGQLSPREKCKQRPLFLCWGPPTPHRVGRGAPDLSLHQRFMFLLYSKK